jgi:hypothetical protein
MTMILGFNKRHCLILERRALCLLYNNGIHFHLQERALAFTSSFQTQIRNLTASICFCCSTLIILSYTCSGEPLDLTACKSTQVRSISVLGDPLNLLNDSRTAAAASPRARQKCGSYFGMIINVIALLAM